MQCPTVALLAAGALSSTLAIRPECMLPSAESAERMCHALLAMCLADEGGGAVWRTERNQYGQLVAYGYDRWQHELCAPVALRCGSDAGSVQWQQSETRQQCAESCLLKEACVCVCGCTDAFERPATNSTTTPITSTTTPTTTTTSTTPTTTTTTTTTSTTAPTTTTTTPTTTTTTTSTTSTPATTTPPYEICGAVVDLVMLLDMSGSVGANDFRDYARKFAIDVVSKRTECKSTTASAFAISVSSFSENIVDTVGFDQTDGRDNEYVQDLIKANILWDSAEAKVTHTDRALAGAGAQLLAAGRPEQRERRHVFKAVMVITDGTPHWSDDDAAALSATVEAADALRRRNVTVVCVGVAHVNRDSLVSICGDSKLVFTADSYASMSASLGLIMDKVRLCAQCAEERGAAQCLQPVCIREYAASTSDVPIM